VTVVGKGTVDRRDGAVIAPAIDSSARTFKDRAAADAWRKTVLPRLRSEWVIAIPDRLDVAGTGRDAIYRVEVLAYRVYDPCDGELVLASPGSQNAPADSTQCPETNAQDAAAPVPAVAAPASPAAPAAAPERLPEQVTTAQVSATLAPLREAGQVCFDKYGIQGTARLKISFDGDGKVTDVTLSGDFADTPTGSCVVAAVEGVSFPRSRRARTTVTYPVQVR
jgi:hypothetical protein